MHPDTGRSTAGRRTRFFGRAPRTRSVLLATGLVLVVTTPFGVAATGDSLREGRRNGTTTVETEVVSNIKSSNALKGGYSTRQSNLSSSGGGAIYGCRSQAGGSKATPTPQNPCLRANNLSRGLAFEFQATIGELAGTITVGGGGDTKKPFTTNATGVATGLNADEVDGLSANELVASSRTRWALIDEKGEIEAQSGGFKILDAYVTNANVYVDAGDELADNGLGATIAIQNQVDVDGAAGADPNFGGEVSIARCQVPNVVECAPASAKNTKAFVVSPRNSDGTATTATTRKRVYVTIAG